MTPPRLSRELEEYQVSAKGHRTVFPSLLINSITTSLSIMKHKLIINKQTNDK